MISKISESITNKLILKHHIDDKDYDIYVYSIFMLLSFLCFVLLSCAFGFLFNCFFESLIFGLSFQFIRKYGGGYHAKTERLCMFLTAFSCVVSIIIIKLIQFFMLDNYILILTIFSVCVSCAIVPLATPENPLSENEFRCFRKISRTINIVMLFIVVFSFLLEIERVFAPCCMSLILESILLVAGKVKKIRMDKSEKT